MLTFLVVAVSAFCVALLTFFSGFGLGTLLMPCFALYFPVETAIALTGIVHLLNNVLKFALTAKQVHWQVALRFGLPAVLAAVPGALLLNRLADLPPLASYTLLGGLHHVSLIRVLLGILIVTFSAWELAATVKKSEISSRWMPLGGLLSGFFGGLSGHQGAFRSAFFVRSGMSKEAFVATGIVCAMAVDVIRLGIYGFKTGNAWQLATMPILATAVGSAFLGSWIGLQFIPKMTMAGIQKIVAAMLMVLGIALGVGLV